MCDSTDLSLICVPTLKKKKEDPLVIMLVYCHCIPCLLCAPATKLTKKQDNERKVSTTIQVMKSN